MEAGGEGGELLEALGEGNVTYRNKPQATKGTFQLFFLFFSSTPPHPLPNDSSSYFFQYNCLFSLFFLFF